MRNCANAILVAVLVTAFVSDAVAQSSQAQTLYAEAGQRETTLRRDLERVRPGDAATAVLRRVRALASAYEDMSALFPASGYSDNALWKGALLSADAFWQFGEEPDRVTALRLFQALTGRFPASSLVKQVDAHVRRLLQARVLASPVPDAARAPGAASTATGTAGSAALTPRTTPRRTSTGSQAISTLNSIRRESLPDALRITLELEHEVAFHSERIEGPPRVFIDLQRTRAVDALKDATIPFPDDVVKQVRIGRQPEARTRVVLDLDGAGRYSIYALYDPYRVVVDFERVAPSAKATPASTQVARKSERIVEPGLPAGAPGAAWPANATASKVAPANASAVVPPSPSPTAPANPTTSAPAAASAAPTAVEGTAGSGGAPASASAAPSAPSVNRDGSFSLSRQLGLGVARIVIDAGHGGHDPGARVRGLTEAELVLDVALRLEQLLLKQPGVEVVLTRRTNTYVTLEERTAIANREGADLFLSIHANASGAAAARGVETYFLNFAPNKEAEAIAARENAGSSRTMRNLPDIVRSIALNNKIDESRDFAAMVQTALYGRLRRANRSLKDLGVKQAPFSVLIGATMPSVLAEIAFITNRQEATLLKTEKYRQQIAEALLAGVMKYQQSLKKTPTVARQ